MIPTIEAIKRAAASEFGVESGTMDGKSRARHIARPRQVAMYLARELTLCSLGQIGIAFGRRDHTTVRNAVARVAHLLQADPALAGHTAAIRNRLLADGEPQA